MFLNVFAKNIFSAALISFLAVSAVASGTAHASETAEPKKKFVQFDISGSAGNYNGHSYTELNAGLNLNFTDWLTWRNAVFKRMTAGLDDTTGLDSSIRLYKDLDGITVYAGPGYRWASDSTKNALLGEAGANLNVGRITLGAGAKYLRYDQAQFDSSGAEIKRDDLSYFIAVSGGLGLIF
jgi:hypothetical protein